MDSHYYGDYRNNENINKTKKTITRVWAMVIILIVISLSTTAIYFMIDKHSVQLNKNIGIIDVKIDDINNHLSKQDEKLKNIENVQMNTIDKLDSIENNLNSILYITGKESKIINKINRKTDTIILFINR